MDNYERAIEIYSQCPCDLKDAVRLLDGGLSSEETVRVLKRKKRKQRARDRNEILTQIGDGMIKEMTSGWDGIKSEQRRYRVSCLSRWGTDLHAELLESAHRMLLIWHLLIPMLFLISFIPLVKPLAALLGPYQNLLVALVVLIAIDVVIWAFRIYRLCDDELVHTMWMPMWAFGRWTRWAGKRLLIKDEDNWNIAILTDLVGEEKAKKLMDKKRERATKKLLAECESLRSKERRLQTTRRYCPDWRETKEVYEEVLSCGNVAVLLTILLIVSWIGSGVVAVMLLGRLGMEYLIGLALALCALVGVAEVFVAIRLVRKFIRSDYERELQRTLKRRAIQRVMDS